MVLCFLAFSLVFLSSEIGQQFSNKFEKIDDELYQLDWYLLPMKIQQMLPTIMMNTQPTMVIKCFGSFECNRDIFKKVGSIKFNSQV